MLLEDQVLEAIRAGWIPQGGIAISRDENGNAVFYQAMMLVEAGDATP